jgi:TetR/AcrR family transcriptional regulator, tetracycline repressor protein
MARRRRSDSDGELSRERLVREALALVDAEGLQALSMRRLAARLGVEAASLYYWLPNKAAIVDGVVEAIRAEAFEIDVDRSMPWTDALRFLAYRYREVLHAHPNALPVMARPITTERGMTFADTAIGLLREQGLDVVTANLALTAVVAYVIGSCLGEVRTPGAAADAPRLSDPELLSLGLALPAEQFPNLHALAVAVSSGSPPNLFDDGLEALVRGLALI